MYDLNFSLPQTLYLAESDFLTALENGAKTLVSWHQTWSAIRDDLSLASENGTARNDASFVHSVASRISNIASCYLDVKREEESITSQLRNDCDDILRKMNTLDFNAQPKSPHFDSTNHPPGFTQVPAQNADSSSTPFLTSAHQWLVDNLHNPYPTAEIKAQMAAASSCQVSSINSWFINARRRIGWTALCREHFSNCRADMVDAAYRALMEEDPQHPLSPQLRHSFVEMKVAAEGLNSSILTRSAFIGGLDATVEDSANEHRSQVNGVNLPKATQDSCIHPSTTTPHVPALDGSSMGESEAEVHIAPPIFVGFKRRWSSAELVDEPSSVGRPSKRPRVFMKSRVCLPFPLSSTDGINETSDYGSPEFPSALSALPEMNQVLSPGKRHLSLADATGMPDYPSDLMAASHLHTISDPLPRSGMENGFSIDDWFNTNFHDLFAIPPPVDASEPDFSTSLEVNLFKDYSIPGNPRYAPKRQPDRTHIFTPTSPDCLLQFAGGDTFITPSESVLPSNIIEADCASLEPLIPDIPQTNVDWMSLLNGTEAYQPAPYSTSPQYFTDSRPSPEIDLSVLQLPQVVPVVRSQGNYAPKQAKLNQLHAMQEVVRRMEQELRSEGVVI